MPQREDSIVNTSHKHRRHHDPLLNIGRLSDTDTHTRVQAYVPPPSYPWPRSYVPTRLAPWSSTADLTPGCRAWTRSAGESGKEWGWLGLRMTLLHPRLSEKVMRSTYLRTLNLWIGEVQCGCRIGTARESMEKRRRARQDRAGPHLGSLEGTCVANRIEI